MITLALCEVGTQEEFFCQENLVPLDMWDNPILKRVDLSSNESGHQCWITSDMGIQIYVNFVYFFHLSCLHFFDLKKPPILKLYLCADFNISNCLDYGKCHFSNVHHLDFGVNDHKLAIGQTSDDECDICAIRDLVNYCNIQRKYFFIKLLFLILFFNFLNNRNPLKICKSVLRIHRLKAQAAVRCSLQPWPNLILFQLPSHQIMPMELLPAARGAYGNLSAITCLVSVQFAKQGTLQYW
jgi:hypothetical protein